VRRLTLSLDKAKDMITIVTYLVPTSIQVFSKTFHFKHINLFGKPYAAIPPPSHHNIHVGTYQIVCFFSHVAFVCES
jgi:hypothetical protein